MAMSESAPSSTSSIPAPISLRQRLTQPGLVIAPGVYDMVSLRLADTFGFDALSMTGFGTVASHLGLPDAGLATYSDMVGRVKAMEMCIRDSPNATAQTLRDGWLYTGDMGALDADGFLTLKDRSKDVIISGGSNIYPREVEEVLLLHPQVREVAVVGQRDAEWGLSLIHI